MFGAAVSSGKVSIHAPARGATLDEFMRTTGIPELSEWHGYASDTYFSGVIIKISPDGERYMIGRYYA